MKGVMLPECIVIKLSHDLSDHKCSWKELLTNQISRQGKLTSQGKLLQQETFFVTEQDTGVLSRSKERRVFLFEQIVIISELLRKGSSTPGYQFKKSIKVQIHI